ncbi:MAG: MATE family efflux transporter [Muribaculaceae bacterium]|nr:MATE family efflux transporter [Muribaculaceae bacterium]
MNRSILKIAIPAIIANIAEPLLGLLDVGIAGHLGSEAMIGAIAVGAMMFNLVYWNFGFLRMGTSGMVAQAYGRNDVEDQALLLRQSTALSLIIGLLIVALQVPLRELVLWIIGPSQQVYDLAVRYFNIVVWGAPAVFITMALKGFFLGMQDAKSPMILSIGVNVLNIVFSLIAVLALNIGFVGIAVGTLAAQLVGVVAAVIMVAKKHGNLLKLIRLKQFFSLANSRRFFNTNVFIFLRSTALMAVMLAFIAIGARMGDMTLAVNSLMMQLFTLYSHFLDGFAFAGEALVGKYYGKGDSLTMRLCVNRLLLWAISIAGAFTLIYILFPESIFSLLTTDSGVVTSATTYQWWCAVIPLAAMAAFVYDGVYIGLTHTRVMFVTVLIATTLFFVLNAILPASLGNHRLWIAFISFLIARGLGLLLHYRLRLLPASAVIREVD